MPSSPDTQLIADLVLANRILVDRGVLDAFGHVSVRSAEQPERFLLARNMAPVTVGPDDIISFGLDGETDDQRPAYLERYIHGGIYAARPDVLAVVHSHASSVIPFSVTRRQLRPVMHMAAFLGSATPTYEIRDAHGDDTDLLIRNQEMGAELAATLGGSAVALMRGHGFVSAGASLPLAVYQAVYTQVNARVQQDAVLLGEPIYLTEGEARSASESNAGQVGRAWSAWGRDLAATSA